MNPKEKKLLKILQSEFPVTINPYREIARKLKLSEDELIKKIKSFKLRGIIRRVGGSVNAKQLGFKSVLVAVQVREDNVTKVAEFISDSDNVSHNYLRKDEYNVWFTFSARTIKQMNDFLSKLKRKRGVVDVLVLPQKKEFKINAEFVL
ncbi:MAG: Lrp/AsnC family transcriptional regulator [PVC group bacterium]|nr:Lrp/AsnC family transcriptional regulator [PVC group bacterium]